MRTSFLAVLGLIASMTPAHAVDTYVNVKFNFDEPQPKLTATQQAFVEKFRTGINNRSEDTLTALEGTLTKSCGADIHQADLPDLTDPSIPDAHKVKIIPANAKIIFARVPKGFPARYSANGQYLPLPPDLVIGIRWANKDGNKDVNMIHFIPVQQEGERMFLIPWCKSLNPPAVPKLPAEHHRK